MTAATSLIRRTFAANLWFSAILVLFFALSGSSASAQTTSATNGTTPSGLAPGAPAGSYALSEFDTINIYNGNINFRLPLVPIGGRGSAGHNITLTLDSKKWRVRRTQQTVETFIYTPVWSSWGGRTVGYGIGVLQGRQTGMETLTCTNPQRTVYKYTITRLTFTAADGTEFDLRDQATNGQPTLTPSACSTVWNNSRGRVFTSANGSAVTFIADTDVPTESVTITSLGYTLIYPSGYLYLRDGTRYRIEGGHVVEIRDRNGNRAGTVLDSLNRQVTIAYDVTEPGPYGLCDKITFIGSNGEPRVIRVSKTNLGSALRSGFSLRTISQLFPLNGSSSFTYHDPTVVSSVWLPDGRRYRFFYNSYSELARVELPTGGAFEYDYTPGSGVRNDLSYFGDEFQIYRRVVERRVYADGATLTGRTVYPITATGDFAGRVEKYSPSGTLLAQSGHGFSGDAAQSLFAPLSGLSYSGWNEGQEVVAEVYAVNNGVVGNIVQRITRTRLSTSMKN